MSKNKEIDTDIRSTPQDFFNELNKVFKFDTDVCANNENHKCDKYFTFEQDGLLQEWGEVNWCNPPYSNGMIDKWLKKARKEQRLGKTSVCLIPADTSTKWYQDNILDEGRCTVIPVRRRLKFEGAGSGAKFASHIVVYWGWL